MDGVTTALELEVGVSPVSDWYKAREGRSLIHFGASAGHIPARMAVMKDTGGLLPRDAAMNRAATVEEQQAIEARVERDLDEGGVGMGMGITYTPTATPDEVLSLFSLAAKFKRPVFVHMRGGNVVSSLQEVITDAAVSGVPLHIVHINSAATAKTPLALQMIEGARARGLDVTTEAYPYTASMTEIASAAYAGRRLHPPPTQDGNSAVLSTLRGCCGPRRASGSRASRSSATASRAASSFSSATPTRWCARRSPILW